MPDVTVVVLAHRNVDMLHRCLGELRMHRSSVDVEVVVVANGATREVRRVIDRHDRIVPVVSRANRGFAGGANLGAAYARGSRLAFLNDDALITDGWLDALVHVLDTRPCTAAVGSLVVDPNGRVLEFGSTFDGLSPMALDRGRHLDDLATEGPRDVPYASACSLLVRREVFERLGGFDEAYYPAYFEDADLALRIWEAGHAVTVTPASVIVHAESASTTSLQRDVMFATTGRVFRSRWHGRMPQFPSGDAPHGRLPRRHGPIVAIDDFAPRAESGSGLARARQMLTAITDNGHPVLFHARERRFELDAALRARGVRQLDDPALLPDDSTPRCIVVSRPTNLALGEAVADRFGVPLIYDVEARFSARLETELLLEIPDDRRRAVTDELATVIGIEQRAAQVADAIIAISLPEADWFRARGARNVWVVDPFPDVCDVSNVDFEGRHGAVFIAGWLGGVDTPNGDGLRWLAREVIPRAVARDPGFRLQVTGASPPQELLRLASPHLEFIGEVGDLGELMDGARATVCPIRYGAGVKNKVVDSLACGVPVVSTQVGAEGIDEQWWCGMTITDDPDVFADALVDLMTSAHAWNELRSPLVRSCRAHRNNVGAEWGRIIESVQETRRASTVLGGDSTTRSSNVLHGASR